MIPSNFPPQLSRTAQVLVAGDQDLYEALDRIVRFSNWRLRYVTTCREAIEFVNDNEIAVIICQPRLPDGYWTTLLTGLQAFRKPPNLIVTARAPEDALWAEVLNLGGYDLLVQPFARAEVFAVVSSAWRRWHSREAPLIAELATRK